MFHANVSTYTEIIDHIPFLVNKILEFIGDITHYLYNFTYCVVQLVVFYKNC